MVRVGRERDLLDRLEAVGRALDAELAVRSHSRSSSAASSRCAAIFRALSRILRAAIAVAAPATGVERERVRPEPVGRGVGVAVLDLDVRDREAELLGDDLGERRLVALALASGRRSGRGPCRSGGRGSRTKSNILSPRMSKSCDGPAPTISVKLLMPMPMSSPRARFSACSLRSPS